MKSVFTRINSRSSRSLAELTRQILSLIHTRAHETPEHLVCRLLLEKKKKKQRQEKEHSNYTDTTKKKTKEKD